MNNSVNNNGGNSTNTTTQRQEQKERQRQEQEESPLVSIKDITRFKINSLASALQFAEVVSKTGFCPKSFVKDKDPKQAVMDVALAIMSGMELGMSPLNALRSFAVINGSPALWGTAKNALVIQSGNLVSLKHHYEGTPNKDDYTCIVEVVRRNPSITFTASFSIADAKQAGLMGKDIWCKYTKKMLYNRAKANAFNECFAELFFNLYDGEEIASGYDKEQEQGIKRVEPIMQEGISEQVVKQIPTATPALTPQEQKQSIAELELLGEGEEGEQGVFLFNNNEMGLI